MKDHIILHDKAFKPFLPYEKLMEGVRRVAEQITRDFRSQAEAGDPPVLVCVLTGSLPFTCELMKLLPFNVEIVSLKLSSYEGTSSTGEVRKVLGLSGDITGRSVIIVEDIVDTGTTIVKLVDIAKEAGARDIKVCTMLLKPEIYKKTVKLDYVALEIPCAFIVGFGLDYNELGRNYPDIYVLDPDYKVEG